ncbi:MAG: GNAT family N-acetyltransferase [Candidatus Limnocylindria bacterium]
MDPLAGLGLALRAPTLDDLEAVVELYVASDLVEFGEPDTDLDETRDFWRQQDLANDHWILTDGGGSVVAAAEVSRDRGVHLEVWVTVHPDWRRRGIGSRLADLGEARAAELVERAPEGTRVTARAWVNAREEGVRAFVAARGYGAARRFWRMKIEMGEKPPGAPAFPTGITVRTFRPGQDERATWQASEEAFADHWGHVPAPFEEWVKRTQGETFDPRLWFLAMDGDAIAGTSLCARYLEMGWVGTLGVRRAWRGRGLGEALLRHSFVEFHRQGRRSVALGVDAESLTGATRLYERAGMHVDRVHELWTRILRDGRVLEGT